MNTIITPSKVLAEEDFDKYIRPVVELIVHNGFNLVFTFEESPEWFIFIVVPSHDKADLYLTETQSLVPLLCKFEATPMIKEISVIGLNLSKLIPEKLSKVTYYSSVDNFKYRHFFC